MSDAYEAGFELIMWFEKRVLTSSGEEKEEYMRCKKLLTIVLTQMDKDKGTIGDATKALNDALVETDKAAKRAAAAIKKGPGRVQAF